MQTLRIGSTETLVFFDRSSNTNIIQGKLASRENVQCVSDKSIQLSVVGGSMVRSKYGSYRLNLGPTEDSTFH